MENKEFGGGVGGEEAREGAKEEGVSGREKVEGNLKKRMGMNKEEERKREKEKEKEKKERKKERLYFAT